MSNYIKLFFASLQIFIAICLIWVGMHNLYMFNAEGYTQAFYCFLLGQFMLFLGLSKFVK